MSTRYRDRERSLEPIVDLIASQYASRPGNYLGFLSSFDYLARVAELMRARHPQVPVWQQTPGMDEAGRKAFLGRFTEEGRGVGFAVLGGAFAEGVDLPGKRLIGAFIATLGLPQVNPVNENMRRLLDARYGRTRLRLRLSVSRHAEGGAGGRPRDPHGARQRHGAPDRRPLPPRQGARAAAGRWTLR